MTSAVQLSDGARVQVKILGDDDKKRPLLIALHGAPGLSDHKEPESSFGFLASDFRVLVYDARGSGESDLKGPYTHERWVADIEELRVWAGAERFALAGGSYGGFVALEYAIAHPERLKALVLRVTWAYGLRGVLNVLKNLLTSDRIHPNGDRQVRVWSGNVRDNQDFEDAWAEIVNIYKPKQGAQTSPAEKETRDEDKAQKPKLRYKTHNFAFSFNQSRFDVRPRLKDIAAPTLVTTGRHDVIVPFEYGEEISRGIPQSRLVIFEHSGHSPPSDEPDAFRKTVKDFLSEWAL
ncbi:Proline iminopeptidase [Colletotrichum spinosum]|uniref:Proline iminopeptidase n=1 Tax=Colletotrichum spinosum TaxID=1347390 RepID=A0A4R8QGL7_9PEZI|nr:Proline iminopeptidase [Colletotrichum spinosum]